MVFRLSEAEVSSCEHYCGYINDAMTSTGALLAQVRMDWVYGSEARILAVWLSRSEKPYCSPKHINQTRDRVQLC